MLMPQTKKYTLKKDALIIKKKSDIKIALLNGQCRFLFALSFFLCGGHGVGVGRVTMISHSISFSNSLFFII